MQSNASEFPLEEWEELTKKLPIAGADVLPTRFAIDGTFEIGLILRDSPFGEPRWCHLGGRQRIDETQRQAAQRHLLATLERANSATADKDLDPDVVPLKPQASFEFLRVAREGFGLDPRKHAVSACFLVRLTGDVVARTDSDEAIDFRWFASDRLPTDAELWPGTRAIIDLLTSSNQDDLVAYEALNVRQVTHNSLMWQTPALAMTAQAFLLAIALGHDSAIAARVISSALSLFVALISVQLMIRHSAMEVADARRLYGMEMRRGMEPVHQYSRKFKLKSRTLWTVGLSLFGAAALAALVLTLFVPTALGQGS